jgi:hypothetical protein
MVSDGLADHKEKRIGLRYRINEFLPLHFNEASLCGERPIGEGESKQYCRVNFDVVVLGFLAMVQRKISSSMDACRKEESH